MIFIPSNDPPVAAVFRIREFISARDSREIVRLEIPTVGRHLSHAVEFFANPGILAFAGTLEECCKWCRQNPPDNDKREYIFLEVN